MFDCSSGLAQWLRDIFLFKSKRKSEERKSSVSASSMTYSLPEQATREKTTSTESLDSGFIELSESSSSFSLKSILRQSGNNTAGIDPKKKVSICTPENTSGGRGKIVVCNDKEEILSDISASAISNVSSQIDKIITASKVKLVDQFPELKPSIELLFEKDLDRRLASLSTKKIAQLLYRVILFCPPQQNQDIIINKIIDLLLAVTMTMKLEGLHEECLAMWLACKSSKYYENTEFYWTHAQTLMISVWCKIIVL